MKNFGGNHIEELANMKSTAMSSVEVPWPERTPIPENFCTVPTLPVNLLPDALRPWLEDAAERASIPLELVAVPAIVSLGAVVGRSMGIRPERFDNWLVVPNLWGCIVANSGLLKSHAISEGQAPLEPLEAEARSQYAKARLDADSKRIVIEAQIATRKRTKSVTREEMAGLLTQLREAEVIERRYRSSDATMEKIGELMRDNPKGILLSRDELAGWLRTMNKPGREGEREFFLEAWAGQKPYDVDRIGRGNVNIPAICLSVVGSIQPGKFRAYIEEALGDGSGADGLLQRLQLLVWPDGAVPYRRLTRWPATEAKQRAFDIYRCLDVIVPERLGAKYECHEGKASPPFLRFNDDAQNLFDPWRENLETWLRSPEMNRTPAFCAHMAKYRSLLPSLALLFDLTNRVAGMRSEKGEVALEALEKAVGFCKFLEAHARKVYSLELSPGDVAARALAQLIESGQIIDMTPVRDIYRSGWACLRTSGLAKAGLKKLADFGWVRIDEPNTGGRPSEVVRLHPDLRRLGPQGGVVCVPREAEDQPAKNDKSSTSPPSVSSVECHLTNKQHTQAPLARGETYEALLEAFEERAAIREFDGNQDRKDAERDAFDEISICY